MTRAIADVPLPHVAAIYRRVSSLKQSTEDKFSLETQLDAARDWCAVQGWATSEQHVYTDVWTGEDLWQRPGLMRLLEDVDARRVGLVLAHAVDRLTREQTGGHLSIIAERIERAGARLECVTEPLDATPQGVMMRNFRAYAAGIENEKRVERTQRIRRNRAHAGKLLPSAKPLYGYLFDPTNVDRAGRLLKERYIEDPLTAPIVRRIYHEVAAGKSMRSIAYSLQHEGIPTPSGRPGVEWEQGTIAYLCGWRCSFYWGEPWALRTIRVPVPTHLRATDTSQLVTPDGQRRYKHKSREVIRPVAEQVKLPADVAPTLVSRELADAVHARLAWNREHAAALISSAAERGQYDYQALLAGGLAVCGGCGGAISVNHLPSTSRPDIIRHRYVCRRLRVKGACTPRTVECSKLDSAVWKAVKQLLQDREWIEEEVERLRAQPDPGEAAVAGIDRQIADLDTRIANKRKYAEMVDNDRERAAVAGEVTELWRQRDGLEQQRSGALAHYATWREQRDGLDKTLEWCEVVGENMDSADFDTRRLILAALHVRVYVYRTDEKPRARLTLALPLSGVREIPLPLDVQSDKSVTAPYKYPREIEFVTELPKTISGKIRRVELRERERRAKLAGG